MATDTPKVARARTWRGPVPLLALALAVLLSPAERATGAELRDRSVIGKWKLVSVLDLASIASLDEAEAKTLLGKVLTISETMVKVDEEICAAPEFWAEQVVPEPHMQEKLHATAERLRLPNPATMVELGCTDVYIRNPGQLVLLWGGAIFDAVRIDAGHRQQRKGPPATKRVAASTRTGKVERIVKSRPGKPGISPPRHAERKKTVAKARPAPRKSLAGRRGR